jgi:hypothetical protein
MKRPARRHWTWALWAALAGCSGDAMEAAAVFESSSEGAAPSMTSDDSGTSTEAPRDTTGELPDASSESSTTEDVIEAPRVAIAPGDVTNAELVETLAIARNEGDAQRTAVLRLEPGQLPALQAGDRLSGAAEIQVTTRCDVGQTAAGCDYDPQISAQLVLVGDSTAAIAMSPVQTLTCTRAEHHCMFVFRPLDTMLVLDDSAHACLAADDCRIEAVMWAWDAQARAGGIDVVLVGENEGDYLANQMVGSDKARLMAVRERGELGDAVATAETSGTGSRSVPTDATATLVYSHPLSPGDVPAGEQFVIEAKFVTAVSSRARVSSLAFVTTDPAATEPDGLDAIEPGQIGEHNGINCPAGESPCTTRKVGVFRVREDIAAPLFVNVIVKSAVPGGGSANVTVQLDKGWLRATRYAADLDG